jgi:hypothetical protein
MECVGYGRQRGVDDGNVQGDEKIAQVEWTDVNEEFPGRHY